MKLYLGSSDLGNNQDELKSWIRKNGTDIILIPNALDVIYNSSEKNMLINSDKEMLEQVGFDVEVKSLEDYFDNNEQMESDFDKFRAFYAIGGNVFTLRKAMELSGFDKYIKEKSVQENYLYGGYSAGICVLAPKIGILELADTPRNPYDDDLFFGDGLGIIDYLPIPHYKSEGRSGVIMDKIVSYCNQKGMKYRTLKDGESIVELDNSLDFER